ncbi:hypothetical protein [Streptomyces sp. NPDC048527]|uniref:hypothetical protein n=1 Tax=Streptomyces sp. NPDC048527 TaxID=3365568 RepID=UPI003717F5E5
MRTVLSERLSVSYGQLYVASDPGRDSGGGPHETMAGQTQGLAGAALPGFLYLPTGLHTGHIPFTVEVHESAPALDGSYDAWEEIVEVSFTPVGDDVSLDLWGGDGSFPLGLDRVCHRVRYCGSGLDESRNAETVDLDLAGSLERHLLQLWPAPHAPDRLLRQTSQDAAYWHDFARSLPPPPAPEERAAAEREAREREERERRDREIAYEKREWGGRLPTPQLRAVGGDIAGIRQVAPALVHAVDAVDAATQRSVAHWAMRRAFARAGLDRVDWLVELMRAVEGEGEAPLPSQQGVVERLLSDPAIEHTMVRVAALVHGSVPRLLQQAVATPALYAAADPDPLRAALVSLWAEAGTYGEEYALLFSRALDDFPALREAQAHCFPDGAPAISDGAPAAVAPPRAEPPEEPPIVGPAAGWPRSGE